MTTRAYQPHDATQNARGAPRGVVLCLLVALQEPGGFSHPPDELAHDIRRPPEAAEEHDGARERQRQGAPRRAQDEAERDQRDHGPLVCFARGDVVQAH